MSLKKNGPESMISVLSLLFLSLCFALPVQASLRAERQTFSFSKDGEQDLKNFLELCFLNDLTSADVLWANDLTADRLAEGVELIIPTSRQDILPVWQAVQKRRKNASETLVTIKLHGVPQYARETAAPPVAPRPMESAPSAAQAPSETPRPTKAASDAQAALPPQARSQGSEPRRPSPRKEEANRGKKADIREPVLLLSPDGDSPEGLMRLVISGDKLNIVRLPEAPKPRKSKVNGIQRTLIPVAPSEESSATRDAKNLRSKMLWPVDGRVSSGFGRRGRRAFHAGLDIPMPKGTSIRAAKDGVVKQTASAKSRGFRGYGNVIVLDHGNGISTLYAHCLAIKVKQGQRVRRGETIATVGRTGRATTNHVHFEVRVKGKPVDPISYLIPR